MLRAQSHCPPPFSGNQVHPRKSSSEPPVHRNASAYRHARTPQISSSQPHAELPRLSSPELPLTPCASPLPHRQLSHELRKPPPHSVSWHQGHAGRTSGGEGRTGERRTGEG